MPDLKRRRSRLAAVVRFWCLLSLVLLAIPLDCGAQDTDSNLAEVWFDLTKYFPVNNALSLGGDTGIRGLISEEDFTAIYIRPSLEYRYSEKLSLHGGVGLFHAFQDGLSDVNEIRPWGGIKLRWPAFRSIYLENYFRAEGRFLRPQEIDQFLSVLRLRHCFGTVLPLGEMKPQGKGFYAPVSFEVFFRGAGDIPARFINQTRFTVGIGYRLISGWRLQTSYNWIQLRSVARSEFETTAHMIRIQIKG
jgi:hypothetical protein